MRESFKEKGSVKRCRAKLSESDKALLSDKEANLVRWLIRGSYVNEKDGIYFSPFFYYTSSDKRLRSRLFGGSYLYGDMSYGETIAYAVRTGEINVGNITDVMNQCDRNPYWQGCVELTDSIRNAESGKYVPEVHHVMNEYIDELRQVLSEYGVPIHMYNTSERKEYWRKYKALAERDVNSTGQTQTSTPQPVQVAEQYLKENPPTFREDDKEPTTPLGNVEELKEATEEYFREPKEEVEVKPLSPTDDWYVWLKSVREYLEDGSAEQPDIVSSRPYIDGMRMLAVDIPVKALKDAYSKTWPENMRNRMSVVEYDPMTYGDRIEGTHRVTPYIEALIEAEVLPFLVGHSQGGKGHIAMTIAKRRGLDYGKAPCTAGVSPAWFTGRNVPGGFVGTSFLRCFGEGGVFAFDEIDAADSNILLLVNDALTNNTFDNPIRDEIIEKATGDTPFIGMALGNTWGLGADPMYTGRERLDTATLERFRMGRTFVGYDYDLYEGIGQSEYDRIKSKVNS